MKRVGSDLRAMTSAEVTQIINECIRLYGNNPGTSLTVTPNAAATSFEFKLGTLIDRRLPAGPVATSAAPNPGTGVAPSYIAVNYINTLQRYEYGALTFPYKDRGGSSYQNYSYPVFYDENSNYLKAMSWVDIYDTFISPALTRLASGTTTPAENAGTYFVTTSTSETDATLVSSTPVAKDTVSDITAFATGSLPEIEDQPDAGAEISWYLHRVNAAAEGTVPLPLTTFDDGLRTLDKPKFRDMLLDLMQYWAYDPADSTDTSIRYQYGTSAYLSSLNMNTRGSGITDTYTTSYVERTDQNAANPNASAYYSQQVPTGTATVQSTNYLGIGLF
tara:strand:- start:892 stop:1890 length:999 start_codon:yes stop_codon:yes gene_type:complete